MIQYQHIYQKLYQHVTNQYKHVKNKSESFIQRETCLNFGLCLSWELPVVSQYQIDINSVMQNNISLLQFNTYSINSVKCSLVSS